MTLLQTLTINNAAVAQPPRMLNLSPSVGGFSTWDLVSQGTLTIDGPYSGTITPQTAFAANVVAWGPGGSSGGHGATTATGGGTGTATTFNGLTANAGAPSTGATNNTPTAGGSGGTATGGDTNNTGTAGTTGTVGTTSHGGDGGASSGGGGTATGASAGAGVSVPGVAGNAPGGGAGGSARGATGGAAATRRSTGGGGGGGESIKAFTTLGTSALTTVVGDSGAAGTGDQAAGAKGAAGRLTIT